MKILNKFKFNLWSQWPKNNIPLKQIIKKKVNFLKDSLLATPYLNKLVICINLWRKIIAKRRLKNVVVWVMSSPGFTWARFARGNGPLSIYQHTFPVGDRGLALWLGAVYWLSSHPEMWGSHYSCHHHHQLCAAWRCGWVRDVGRTATLRWSSGAAFQEDAQQRVSRSEPADKIRVSPDFVGLLSDSPDLVFWSESSLLFSYSCTKHLKCRVNL